MGFTLDLETISLEEYEETLASATLVPSRQMLKDSISERFTSIRNAGISNLAELQKALKTKKKLQAFAKETGLSEDYLKVLNREVNANVPKPIKLRDLPEVSEDTLVRFQKAGITDTKQLFERVLTPKSRCELSAETGLDETIVTRLTKLTDLGRIRWVNHTFAHVLYEAGYETVKHVLEADPDEMYETVKTMNQERKLYKGNIGLSDMKLLVELAQFVPLDIEYS